MWLGALRILLRGAIIRLFFFLLVFANLIFFAWTQGHFGTTDENREPQRMAQQLHAEKLGIVRVTNAPSAKKDVVVCRGIDGLAVADAEALKSAVAAANMELKILPPAGVKVHLVAIIDLPGKAAADRKAAELTRFGITEQTALALPDGRHEIVLGTFQTEAAANEFLQGLVKRGIKSARVDAREQPSSKVRVEARAPASVLLRQLPQLIAPHADATLADCEK